MAGRTDSGSSITNVAATAGVSIATVSRVLSGKRGKDDDIARRVREAAKQLGYSVNYAASALRSCSTRSSRPSTPNRNSCCWASEPRRKRRRNASNRWPTAMWTG